MIKLSILLFALLYLVNSVLTFLLPNNQTTKINSKINSKLFSAIRRAYQEPLTEDTVRNYVTSRRVSIIFLIS